MPSHSLTNFEIEKYYLYYNYSRDNLPELISVEKTDGAYVINLHEYSDIGTHWVAFYVQKIMMLFILILLEKNIFQNKLKHFSLIKT